MYDNIYPWHTICYWRQRSLETMRNRDSLTFTWKHWSEERVDPFLHVTKIMDTLGLPNDTNFVKCGNATIVEKAGICRTVKYNTCIKCTKSGNMHILEIIPDSISASSYGYINLRKCKVSLCSESSKRLIISKLTADDTNTQSGFVFEAKSEAEAVEWVDCLSSRCCLKASPDTSPLIHRSSKNQTEISAEKKIIMWYY
jgi:hypothetical protein